MSAIVGALSWRMRTFYIASMAGGRPSLQAAALHDAASEISRILTSPSGSLVDVGLVKRCASGWGPAPRW